MGYETWDMRPDNQRVWRSLYFFAMSYDLPTSRLSASRLLARHLGASSRRIGRIWGLKMEPALSDYGQASLRLVEDSSDLSETEPKRSTALTGAGQVLFLATWADKKSPIIPAIPLYRQSESQTPACGARHFWTSIFDQALQYIGTYITARIEKSQISQQMTWWMRRQTTKSEISDRRKERH